MWKRPSVLLGGAAVYVGATTAAYLTFYEPKKDESAEVMTSAKRLQVFNGNADKYDKGADRYDGSIGYWVTHSLLSIWSRRGHR